MENIGLSGYPLKVHLFYYKSDKVYISTNVHSSDQAWRGFLRKITQQKQVKMVVLSPKSQLHHQRSNRLVCVYARQATFCQMSKDGGINF